MPALEEAGIKFYHCFYDFETCEEISVIDRSVRLLVSIRAMQPTRRLSCLALLSAADMKLTPHAATGEGRRHSAAVHQSGAIQAPEED